MATEAQVQANRHNAEKSTGPRTPEGKATVSQNAVKHGLSGRRDVIKGEDQAEFDRHREALLRELRPDGAVESMLAGRVVSLSWRLERVGRMQNEVFDALLAKESTPLAKLARSMIPGKAAEDDGLDLGRAVIKDFANSRVLDRLLMYERRIEHSLLKTLNDLHLRRLRVREYISRHMDELHSNGPADTCQAGGADLGRGPEARDSRARCPRHDADRMSATRVTQHSNIPSFQDSAAGADEPVAQESSCKTTPIAVGPNTRQVLGTERVMTRNGDGAFAEAKPIERGASDYCTPHEDAESLMAQVAGARTMVPPMQEATTQGDHTASGAGVR